VVAIGDLHGDLDAAQRVLRLAGAIDAAGRWIGGNLTVVQTGDQIDRGDDDRAVLDLFERLRDEAPRQGGQVISLTGNHEHMNVEAKLGSVTRNGYRAFEEFASLPGAPIFVSRTQRGRYLAFRPGGPYALKIAKRPLVVVVGTSVLVHGGLLPEHVRHGIERINDQAAAWVRGEVRDRPRFLKKDHSPLWIRRYSAGTPSRADCQRLAATLGPLGARRMVMGHTVQPTGINAACGDRVWRIDVGLSRPYKLGITQALEINGEVVRVLDAGKGATAR
jgi:hypothetical protein